MPDIFVDISRLFAHYSNCVWQIYYVIYIIVIALLNQIQLHKFQAQTVELNEIFSRNIKS